MTVLTTLAQDHLLSIRSTVICGDFVVGGRALGGVWVKELLIRRKQAIKGQCISDKEYPELYPELLLVSLGPEALG